MTTLPEALRLAEQLEAIGLHGPVAAELRRLHEAHDWQYRMAGERLRRVEKLEDQRDALLEALKVVIDDLMYQDHARVIDVARAAIAKAEGEKT